MSDSDTTLPYNPYAASAPEQIMMREKDQSYALDFNQPHLPSFSFHHSTQDSTQLDGGTLGNDSTTDSMNVGYAFKSFNVNCNLNRVKTDSTQLTDAAGTSTSQSNSSQSSNTTYQYQGTTDNATLSLTYQPNDRLNLGTSMSANTIKSISDGTTSTGGGDNLNFTALYKPFKTITLNAGVQTSKTDAETTSTGDSVPAQSTQNQTVGITWQPSKRFSLTTSYAINSAQGGANSDCKTNTISVNSRWNPRDWAKFDGYWTDQTVLYLDTTGNSDSNMIGVNAQFGPIRPLHKSTIELGAQHLWGDTTTGVTTLAKTLGQAMTIVTTRLDDVGTDVTGNEMTTLSGKITCPITKRYDLFFSVQDTRNDGYPTQSQKDTYTIGWNYHLNKNFTFTLDAARVIYLDQADSSLNYTDNQMNAQLSWTL